MKRTVIRALRNPYFVLGSAMVLILLVMLVVGAVSPPYPPSQMDMAARAQPPSADHLMGTDNLGRDVLSRVLVGTRTAFATGLVSTFISMAAGVLLGLIAGFSRPALDAVLTRAMDVMRCVPNILFALMIIAILGASFFNTVLAICFINIPSFYRITRSSVMQVRTREYVVWARVAGIKKGRIMLLHIFPNIVSPIIVMATLCIAQAVLTETSLSYLGLGIQPPHPSWGMMLSDAQQNILSAPWEAVSVGVCISLMVLGFNLLGDGLRDLLDVRST